MTIPAKPTIYKGTQFRSRLEAKWAAFFDACKWRWDYEPDGLFADHIKYIPDFLLHRDGPILVDIKPVILWEDARERAGWLSRLPWRHDIYLCGVGVGSWWWQSRASGTWEWHPIQNDWPEHTRALWAAASNAVQWMPPNRTRRAGPYRD